MPVRYSRWRLLVAVVLLLLFVALLIAGRLLHWDDQLRLYWSERSVTAEQRASGIWLPDYELALETTLAGLEDDETSGLTWNPLTTQIESHDWQAELYADVARFNRILHGFCVDVWSYISIGYFAQIPVAGATGSSTMPHKVNPIRFENAEANLEISCSLLDTLGATLVTSRWQRDLTDSSTQRNIGTALGHSLLAIANIRKGLSGLDVDADAMAADLEGNWEVLGEAVQTVMRAEAIAGVEGMDNPYERLKELTRGHRVDGARMREFVQGLGLSEAAQARLLELTPAGYTGVAAELAKEFGPAQD